LDRFTALQGVRVMVSIACFKAINYRRFLLHWHFSMRSNSIIKQAESTRRTFSIFESTQKIPDISISFDHKSCRAVEHSESTLNILMSAFRYFLTLFKRSPCLMKWVVYYWESNINVLSLQISFSEILNFGLFVNNECIIHLSNSYTY